MPLDQVPRAPRNHLNGYGYTITPRAQNRGTSKSWDVGARPFARRLRTCGVLLAGGHDSADHQLVDAHVFLCGFDGESAVQAFAET